MHDLIYCQRDIPKNQLRYGLRSSAKTGCGWIAMYNALTLLGETPDPQALVHALEKQVPLLHGNIGTTCLAPAILLNKWGYRCCTTSDPRQFQALLHRYPTAILYFYWRKGLRIGAHFVALQATEQGIFGYNTYANSSGPDAYGKDLNIFLREKGYFGCILTGIAPGISPTTAGEEVS